MASPESPSGATVKIDPAGDVILIAGSSETKARLMVSSKALSLASPVFAAMFSPRFKEGSSLDSDHPGEVPLPEDDPEAMTLLCNCIHFHNNHIPRNVEFPLLKTLAILCDKYDASRPMLAWSILWLQPWESKKCEDGFEGLLLMTYALDCAEAFAKFTKKAILEQEGPFHTTDLVEGFEMVPEALLEGMEAQRAAISASLHKAVEDIATPIIIGSCHHKLFLLHAYLETLRSFSMWPLSEAFRKESLLTLMNKLSWMQEPNSLGNKRSCTCSTCGTKYRSRLLEEKGKHERSIIGPCLDCVKNGKSDFQNDSGVSGIRSGGFNSSEA